MLKRISDKLQTWRSKARIARLARAISRRASVDSKIAPVIFFNATARLGYLSQNAAFSLLSAWGLQLAGVPIVHFVCNRGMSRCVLGTHPDDPGQPPPCQACVAQSTRLYANAEVRWFPFSKSVELEAALQGLDLAALQTFTFNDLPLGELVLPSLRWALRRHHLTDDEATCFFYRQYILSAYNIAHEFEHFIGEVKPQAVVLFNGVMYPEAVARHLALKHQVRAITHEVGLLPFTAFFTDGQATAYPMEIPRDFELSNQQNQHLDEHLSQRFQGQFSMAGIHFWPQMQELDKDFLEKAAQFQKIVPVFTNVIFDTSQVQANSLFSDMFAWLDEVLKLIRAYPKTLFVIRAHPDELRPGTRKQSRESVAQWVQKHGVVQLPNVIFVDSNQYLSSYALIQRAHFVMVYNSSIGLEASIMGKPVLCAAAARYTPFETVFYPKSSAEYIRLAEEFLAADHVDHPRRFINEARKVLYFQLFRTALPFGRFLYAHSRMGYVHLHPFNIDDLSLASSPAIRSVYAGVVNKEPFLV